MLARGYLAGLAICTAWHIPHLLAPRSHTRSPASMRKERSSSAARSPRITVTWFSASSGGLFGSRDIGPVISRMGTHAHSIRAAGLLAFSHDCLGAIRQWSKQKAGENDKVVTSRGGGVLQTIPRRPR